MLASEWLSNLQHLQPAVNWKSGSLSRLKSKVEQSHDTRSRTLDTHTIVFVSLWELSISFFYTEIIFAILYHNPATKINKNLFAF